MFIPENEIENYINSGRAFIARNPDHFSDKPFIVRYKQWDNVYYINKRAKLSLYPIQVADPYYKDKIIDK